MSDNGAPRGHAAVRGVCPGPAHGHQSPQLPRPQRHLRVVRAAEARPRLHRHPARLAGFRLHPRLFTGSAPARRAERPALAAGRHRRRCGSLECVHLLWRAGSQLLATVCLPGGRGNRRGGLRAGGEFAGGRLLPRARAGPPRWACSRRALAIGGVLGILLGGTLEQLYGWRIAFMVVGVPGFPAGACWHRD